MLFLAAPALALAPRARVTSRCACGGRAPPEDIEGEALDPRDGLVVLETCGVRPFPGRFPNGRQMLPAPVSVDAEAAAASAVAAVAWSGPVSG